MKHVDRLHGRCRTGWFASILKNLGLQSSPDGTRPLVVREALERRVLLSVPPQGPEFRVNTYTTGLQYNSAIAMDAAGNFVVAWQSFGQDGFGDGIYAQRYSAQGARLGDEFIVNQTTSGNQQLPAIAVDADGDFVVAWQGPEEGGNSAEIWARRFTADGNAAGDEFRVNLTTANNQSQPAVAMDNTGNFAVAWASRDQAATGGDDVYMRLYDMNGVALTPGEVPVNTSTAGFQTSPAVAMDADGDFIVVWHGLEPLGNSFSVYAQRFDKTAAAQGTEFIINEYLTAAQRSSAVAMDDAGNFVVAWESAGQDGEGYGVYAKRFSAAGAVLTNEFPVNTHTADSQRIPAIAMDSDGDFVITWASRLQDGSGYGIYAQAYDAAAAPVGTEFRVNTTTDDAQFNPTIAMDSDGDLVIAWHSSNQDGDSFGVYAQRFGTTGGGGGFEIVDSQFRWEDAPQRLVYTFTGDASTSLSNTDLLLENLTSSMTVDVANVAVSFDPMTSEATFTFPGLQFGALEDGNYRATILAGDVTDPGGTPLPGDHMFEFFFLNGDATRDRIINLADFNALAGNFGQTGRTFSEGDFTYDGVVNLADFNILAGKFGQTLPEPMPIVAPVPMSAHSNGSRLSGKSKNKDDALENLLA